MEGTMKVYRNTSTGDKVQGTSPEAVVKAMASVYLMFNPNMTYELYTARLVDYLQDKLEIPVNGDSAEDLINGLLAGGLLEVV